MSATGRERALAERGWLVVDLPDPAPVLEARHALESWLRLHRPGGVSLERYHEAVPHDDDHVAVLHDLARRYWEGRLGRAIVERNLELFRDLAGADLNVQRRPYLRAVRPGRPADAQPLHRDTYYGASPYELSVLVPFTSMDATAAMRIVPGSHLEPDAAYPFRQTASADVTMRSPRHELGYPYAPRLLDPALDARAVPVPLRVGQAAIFGLALVHGGGVNDGAHTRFSTDIRVVNAWAPVRMSRGVDAEYFEPLCLSAATRSARLYLDANARGPSSRESG
jgi:hypothetical protein